MPFGLPSLSPLTPEPSPAKKFFGEFEEAMRPSLDASKAAAEQRYQATVEMTEAAVKQVQQMQNPVAMAPVPQINPLLAGAAGFFGSLNQQQTGNGQILAGAQNMLSNQVAQGQRASEQNAAAQNQFGAAKQQSTEELHMALLKAKRDQAAETGNLDETFQHNKALYALERQKKQEEMKLAADLAEGKTAATGAARLKEIEARGVQARLTAGTVARYRKEAASHATTPAQRARLAMANAEVAELRASVDDMRAAKDIAGELLYSSDEIAVREAAVKDQIKTIYEGAIADFEGEKTTGTVSPNAAPKTETPATPPAGSDRVRAAAERLRGTPLFQ